MSVIKDHIASLEKFLNQPGKINDLLTKLEESSGVKRIYIVFGKRITIDIALCEPVLTYPY